MKKNKKNKIVVGMSGGVDSSMALALLKEKGWDPVGVSLKYAIWQNKKNLLRENVCCSTESFDIAKKVCQKLSVKHYVYNVSKEFKKEVMDYFITELKNNRTPNPCVICNPNLKFKKLFEWAEKHGIEYVATGHYADIKRDGNKYLLKVSKDKEKDQTYSLSFLPQKWLKNIIFPLGEYTKREVFEKAKIEGFKFYLKRKQSQDFCFVAGNCLDCFLESRIGLKKGRIEDEQGNILGSHNGLYFYTIGQRKGLNLAAGPYFVLDKQKKNNVLLVGKKKRLTKEAELFPINYILGEKIGNKTKVSVKVRSHQQLAEAELMPISSKKAKIVFEKPQESVTPGQYAVFYKKDICLGAGRITKTS